MTPHAFIMNSVIAASIAAITVTGVLVLHDWTGLWSLVLLLITVVPSSKPTGKDE